jgi:hypothetical protein
MVDIIKNEKDDSVCAFVSVKAYYDGPKRTFVYGPFPHTDAIFRSKLPLVERARQAVLDAYPIPIKRDACFSTAHLLIKTNLIPSGEYTYEEYEQLVTDLN